MDSLFVTDDGLHGFDARPVAASPTAEIEEVSFINIL
jgi:hypothetical protein